MPVVASPVEDALKDLRRGQMVILVDDAEDQGEADRRTMLGRRVAAPPAAPDAAVVRTPTAGATESTSCLAASPAAARITDVSLPSPCPRTTPTAVSWRPPTVTWVKKARHPPAAESDPVLPA